MIKTFFRETNFTKIFVKLISRKKDYNILHFFFGFLLHTVVGAILIIFFQWWQWTAKGQQCGKFLCSKNMINNNRYSCVSVAIFYVCLRIENKFKHSFGWKVKKIWNRNYYQKPVKSEFNSLYWSTKHFMKSSCINSYLNRHFLLSSMS